MATFDVAHIREQGVDLVIIPLNRSFEAKPKAEQQRITNTLQLGARAAGLAGTVVPVWESCGRMAFLAPHGFHPFFRGITPDFVQRNLNRRLVLQ